MKSALSGSGLPGFDWMTMVFPLPFYFESIWCDLDMTKVFPLKIHVPAASSPL